MGDVQGRVSLRVHNGALQVSVDGGATWASANVASGWNAERAAVAVARCPTLNRFHGTDFLDGEFFLSAAGTPTQVATESNGILKIPGSAATGYVSLGKLDSQVLVGAPKTESWYIASRVKNPAAGTFSAAGNIVMLGLYQAGHFLYVVGNQAHDNNTISLNMNNGVDHFNDLVDLGSAQFPTGVYNVIGMWFNSVTGVLGVDFNDVTFTTFSGSGITNMSTQAGSVLIQSNDLTFGLQADGLFLGCIAPT